MAAGRCKGLQYHSTSFRLSCSPILRTLLKSPNELAAITFSKYAVHECYLSQGHKWSNFWYHIFIWCRVSLASSSHFLLSSSFSCTIAWYRLISALTLLLCWASRAFFSCTTHKWHEKRTNGRRPLIILDLLIEEAKKWENSLLGSTSMCSYNVFRTFWQSNLDA